MTKPLLLLHNRHTPDDSDIWRVAVRRGWNTARVTEHTVKAAMEGHDHIRYYGNTLHAKMIEDQLPIGFLPIDYSSLARIDLYTRRKVGYTTFDQIVQPITHDTFIKPARDKWFEARVYKAGETIAGVPWSTDEVYISDVMSFANEARCFVLNGQIMTAALYRIDGVPYGETDLSPEDCNMDEAIKNTILPQWAAEICAMGDLPPGVVIDFGQLSDGTWAVIEFNEAWASGLYYCDPEKCFDVIVASQQ
jgi:ATP-grasp domain-containing protein